MTNMPVVPRAQDDIPIGAARDDEYDGDREVSLLTLAAMLLKHRKLIASFVAFAMGITVLRIELRSATYTASAVFITSLSRSSFGVSSLAAEFGLSLPGGSGQMGPQFYADLLETREILRSILASPFPDTSTDARASRIIDSLGVSGKDDESRRERALRKLGMMLNTTVSPKTGFVTVTARATSPRLASTIVAHSIDAINGFALAGHQSQATAERKFVEQRLEDVGHELRAAEDELQSFVESNRDLHAPALQFREDRLRRAVAEKQGVYSALAQAYEQAKIDEVRDTPSIMIIDPPKTPVVSDGRGLAKWLVVSCIGGLMMGLAVAFLKEYFAALPARDPVEFARLNAVWRRIRS